MEKSIQIFNHPEFGSVRVVEIDGEPFFVGRDVAIALGYSNSRDALAAHVPDKFKKDGVTIRDTIGIEQYPTLISEAGMYKLVMRSKLSNAENFRIGYAQRFCRVYASAACTLTRGQKLRLIYCGAWQTLSTSATRQ